MEEKIDKSSFMKEIHENLMEVRGVNELLKKSIVDHIEVNRDGAHIVLNKAHGAIKMRINESDYEEVPISIMCFGNYEKEETDMVCKVLEFYKDEDNFTVFDVGANVGWYTLNIMNQFQKMKVYSFEPSPVTYKRLMENMKLNGFHTDNVFNLGFYKESGQLDFYFDSEGSGASSLVNLREKSSVNLIRVNMKKIDDWVNEIGIDRVDFIKCDVEGAEYFVYQGGKNFIAANKPIIFSEMLRKWSAKFNYTPNDIINFMAEMGYVCYVIHDGRLKECPVVDDHTIETNYFFMHRDKHASVINQLSD